VTSLPQEVQPSRVPRDILLIVWAAIGETVDAIRSLPIRGGTATGMSGFTKIGCQEA
jgi:hypothetical protein